MKLHREHTLQGNGEVVMENVTLTIDGLQVSVPPGTTVLDTAGKAGIEIPRLCHRAEITPSGNCRICVVEVEGARTLLGSDVPLVKEVCKDCGICIEYCPTSALMWPEGVKKRQETAKKPVPKTFPGNGTRHKLLGLLKSRQQTEGYVSETAMQEIAESLTLPLSALRYGNLLYLSFYKTKGEKCDQDMQESALLPQERVHDY
jgi:ferredoxin